MKLGTETGSVINHLYSRMTKGQPDPEVGMGATICHWSDRSAGTIVKVQKDKQGRWLIHVQGDHAKVVSGSTFNGSAVYEYERNLEGGISQWRFENGRWSQVYINPETQRLNKIKGGNGLSIGRRDAYHDPHF